MKNKFNLDNERKKSESRLYKFEKEDQFGKKYDIKLNPFEVITILVFVLSFTFIIYLELNYKGGLSFWVG